MEGNYVKKETLWIAVLVVFVVGFLSGIVFAVFKISPSTPHPQHQHAETNDTQEELGQPRVPQNADQIMALERELATHPENLQAWIALGNIHFDAGMADKAIAAYEKALELNPDNANVWTDLGVMYRRNERPNEALEAFEKAIGLDPKHEQSRMNKGVVLFWDLNDKQGAIQAWEDLLAVNPGAKTPSGESVTELIKMARQQ